MSQALDNLARVIARYLERPRHGCEPFWRSDPDALRALLRPGDVLLVDGSDRMANVIKYLTQSTWSHVALFVGAIEGRSTRDGEPHVLVEANISEGVVSAPLSKYHRLNTRVCRPVGLTGEECERVCEYALERIGLGYDLQIILDLLRYLFPIPLPRRFRRGPVARGSLHPTRFICSTLVAQAFETICYPILPEATRVDAGAAQRDISKTRRSSLYAPRDFDISPHFETLKPATVMDFRRQQDASCRSVEDPMEDARSNGAKRKTPIIGTVGAIDFAMGTPASLPLESAGSVPR